MRTMKSVKRAEALVFCVEKCQRDQCEVKNNKQNGTR